MKRAAIFGERRGGVVEVPDPQPKAEWVVVKVHAAPMCTEYKTFLEGNTRGLLGHEAAGEVVAVAQQGRVKVGDRVVVMPLTSCGKCELCLAGDYIYCQNSVKFSEFHGTPEGNATMAQYLLKPDWMLVPIPEGMSYEHAGMACCGLGPTFGAAEAMGVARYDTVLITGMGPVGLGGVLNMNYRGARTIAVEMHPWRVQKALELGAAAVVNPQDEHALQQIMDLTGGRGVDAAIDCSGVVAAHRLCIDATRRRGKIAFVGESHADTPLRISPDMIRKGLALIGSWHYNMADTPKMMRMIADMGDTLDELISHTFPLDQIQQAWETQVSGNCAKVILKPWL
jgi:L-iditol 2-dehydrogenase